MDLSMPNSVFGHWSFRSWLLNVFVFLPCVELANMLTCQLFSLFWAARSVELERSFILLTLNMRKQLTTLFFSPSQSVLYLLHRLFVYIVYMKSFIPDWDSLQHWHLPPQMTVGMKLNPVFGVSTKDRRLIIFARKPKCFADKDKLFVGT